MITTALYNEIAHTRMFEMQESAFFNHARMFLSHYRDLTADEKSAALQKGHFVLKASTGFKQMEDSDSLDNGVQQDTAGHPEYFINVIRFSGPMMRHGGACAYGSIEIRDMIMRAADMENCIGHIFIVDTPGGSSATKDDLQEAMDYAHGKGQETAMQVDGMVMSAGMAWASMCRKRYARHPHNLLGCMGTYASFYTNRNKDVNTITQEMFHVVYADGSPDKNKPFRDAAEGDQEAVREMVNRENDRYKEIIRAGIPNVTDEQLLGGEWEAKDVIGTLCDGIRSLDEIALEMMQARGLADGRTEEPEEPETPQIPENPEDNQQSINNQNFSKMGKQYEKIQSALGWPTLNSGSDNSLWLHEEMADELTAFVENAEKLQIALEAKQADVNSLVKQMEQLKADHDEALEAARKEMAQQAAKDIEAVNADKSVLEAKVVELEAKVAEQVAVIEEKDKAISEYAASPGPLDQPAVLQPAPAEEKKNFLASDCNNRKEAKQVHENLMQMLLDRM